MAGLIIFGIAAILIGGASIALRGRQARANAASNSVMFGGRLSGPGFQRYSRTVSAIVGSAFVVIGVVCIVLGATGHGSHHH